MGDGDADTMIAEAGPPSRKAYAGGKVIPALEKAGLME